jgi:DNA invertase Pin-like site-specific DNA recombinase
MEGAIIFWRFVAQTLRTANKHKASDGYRIYYTRREVVRLLPRFSRAKKAYLLGVQMRAIYVRTSTDDNDGAAQLHELRKWCEAQRWQNVKEWIDRGESGTKESRPAWDDLRKMAASGRVDALVCTELSRLGRSVVGVILSLDALHTAGCRVVLLRQGLDYATPVGRAVAAILAAVAQLEREQICERVRAGVKRAQSEGTRSGKPIGRPRAYVSTADINACVNALEPPVSRTWAALAREMGLPETTLRRAVKAHQKGMGIAREKGTEIKGIFIDEN